MHVTPDNVESLAREKWGENHDFRAFLKWTSDMPEEELDALVAETARRVWDGVDCTQCARCCEAFTPCVTDAEQQRSADELGVSVEELRGRYLLHKPDDPNLPPWRTRGEPCAFLKDRKCTIYEVRPSMCRDYPHLHEPEFAGRTLEMIERTLTCPIVYQVMEELKVELDFRSEDEEIEDDWCEEVEFPGGSALLDHLRTMFAIEHEANATMLSALKEDDAEAIRIMQHVVVTQQGYLAQISDRPWPEAEEPWSLDRCKARAERSAELWRTELELMSTEELDGGPVQRTPQGVYAISYSDLLTHVVTHGFHHRAVVDRLLREAGREPPRAGYAFLAREELDEEMLGDMLDRDTADP